MDFARTRGTDWLCALGGLLVVAALAGVPWWTVGGVGLSGADTIGALATIIVLAAALLIVLPIAVALATPEVRAVLLRIALVAAALIALIVVVRIALVPDLDLFDYRARGVTLTPNGGVASPSGRTGTSRSWGGVLTLVLAVATTAVAWASVKARRGVPTPPPPPS